MKKQKQSIIQSNVQKNVSIIQLFRFTNTQTIIYILIGSLAAIINGAIHPIYYLIYSKMYGTLAITDKNMRLQTCKTYLMYLIMVGCFQLISSWIMHIFWTISAQKQILVYKKKYLRAILQQQVSWFDIIDQSQLFSIFQKSCMAYNQSISQKITPLIQIISMLIAQFIVIIVQGWQLGLFVLAILPSIYISVMIYGYFLKKKSESSVKTYQQADGKVQQSLLNIKTIKSMNGMEHQSNNFSNLLKKAHPLTIKYSIYSAISNGIVGSAYYICTALAFWYGGKLLTQKAINYNNKVYTIDQILAIVLIFLCGVERLTPIETALKKLVQGKQAAIHIFDTIDRVPLIDKNQNGIILNDSQFKGVIKFQNVKFAYPKQPNKIVLENISFEIMPNQRVAFVGESGCGKSTITQLIMRFYDPQQGRITLDGIDLKSFNLHWLRSKMGYVSQQPVLFATSIRQNLLMANPNATQQQLIQALKTANAYDFTMELIDKMDTYVGEGGTQISGGQKQRIAIARALLKKGKIIMFDQATSALDMNNEILIQQTLEKISGMTIINIAHRVTTIQNSDIIFVIAEGRVSERGKFNQLKKFKNVNLQKFNFENKKMKNYESKTINSLDNEQKQSIYTNLQQKLQYEKIESKGIITRLFSYSQSDIGLFLFGCFLAAINGISLSIFPILQGLLLASVIKSSPASQINNYCIMIIVLSFIILIINSTKFSIFWYLAENLTLKLRMATFMKLLKMPIWWFDNPQNSRNNLMKKLAVNCRQLNGLTSVSFWVIIQSIAQLIVGCISSFYFDWKITLVAICIIPLMFGSMAFQMKLMNILNFQQEQQQKKSIINEVFLYIRTIYSINGEERIIAKFQDNLIFAYDNALKKSHIIGISNGITLFIFYISIGVLVYISIIFTSKYNLGIVPSILGRNCIIYAATMIGMNIRLLPDFVSGKLAAANIFKILDDEDEQMIQIRQNSRKLEQGYYRGDIEINNLTFKYPQRNTTIFKNFNMKVKGGTKVALVGQSGAGKSTILQILLRFYEPQTGDILIDGINIKDFDIHYLRSLFGVVSQEPVLFNISFKQNIQYNKFDATQQDIKMAAKSAYAYDFIEGNQKLEGDDITQQGETILSKGFDRNVGLKGGHISGGQKQRVAIARVILRKPKMVLLDEATSALDKNNEKLVQSALDKLMVNKTSITIAHRLDTIRNSDKIMVIKTGKIAQQGTYEQLIARKGQLYNLERGIFVNYSQ